VAGGTLSLVTTIVVTDPDADADAEPVTHRIEKSLTAIDESQHRKGKVATATTRTLWDPAAAGEQVGSFRFLAFWADQDVLLEFTTANGDVDESLGVVTVAANVPFLLGSDDGKNNYTSDALGAGDADVIDLIRMRNASGSDCRYNLVLVE
jgi:hypothetical protein